MKNINQIEELIIVDQDNEKKSYKIIDVLGEGGVGITYLATDQKMEQVAIKVLSLQQLNDWKQVELFEREAKILSQLHHPAIPEYLNYFQIETPQNVCFYIVQKLAKGTSLAALIAQGWQPSESEVKDIAIQLLEILNYLHSLTPPVIHRDIKPQNIIREDNGKIYLVDFGAVQDTYHNTVTGGSTVVGTYGYMAPEQFRGQAVPSTDLYGLATTLLFLLARKCPTELPQRHLKIDFHSHVNISSNFANWLEYMLEPSIKDRCGDANTALKMLQGKHYNKPQKPKNTFIKVKENDLSLIIDIPPGNSNNYTLFLLMIYPILLSACSIISYYIELLLIHFKWIEGLSIIISVFIFIWLFWKYIKNIKNSTFIEVLFIISFLPIYFIFSSLTCFTILYLLSTVASLLLSYSFGLFAIIITLNNLINFMSHRRIIVKNNYINIEYSLLKFTWCRRDISYKGNKYLRACKFLTKVEKQWLELEINQFMKNIYKKNYLQQQVKTFFR